MTREINTPIVLSHQNIIPGTEIVSVKGSTLPKFTRNSDYIIDYQKGELRFLSDGAAVSEATLIENNGLDIEYSYQIDFTDPNLFESQKEVFDEVARRVDPFVVRVKNSPINDVSRVFNLTTQEEYQPTAIDQDQITFTGINPPRTKNFENKDTILQNSTYSYQRDLYLNTYKITYPSSFSPDVNPVTNIFTLTSRITYPRLIIAGGQDFLTNTIELFVPLEVVNIELFTGGRTLRKSNDVLRVNTDYSFTLESVNDVIDHYKLTISLNPSAQQKIRTNNLYMNLIFSESFDLISSTEGLFQTTTHPVNETVNFLNDDRQSLTKLFQQVSFGDLVDQVKYPQITVFNPDTGFIYEEEIDYTLNLTQKTITRNSNGRINGLVLVTYREEKNIKADFQLVSDIVLVDYVWGTNSLNWSNLRKEVPITQVEQLKKGQRFISLKQQPLDPEDILIYIEGDTFKKPVVTIEDYNSDALRLQISSISTAANYIVEYIAISEPIPEGTPYYATYKYGATRRAVKDRFARLMSLDETTTPREEIFAMSAGQNSITLSRSPTSLDTVIIFAENDPQEAPVSTPTKYDNISGTLSFTPLASSGRYVIKYRTLGFDTNSLRNAIKSLFENFSEGPTRTGFENIISSFVSTPPEISSGLSSRFVLPDEQRTIGNRIQNREFEVSPDLPNGDSTVTFQPARFNLGALLETTKRSYIRAPAANNVSLLEGTVEFLFGAVFNPDDNQRHYFIDIVGENPNKNRLSIYKSKNNFINFDIWDNSGNLFRTSSDVSQTFYTEIIDLEVGDTTAVLSRDATPAQIDLDEDNTPDLYEGLETKFILMPETGTYPPTFKRASIKVLGYDPPTRTVTFEPVKFSGRYVFSYVSGLAKYEETENFIAATWKLHTLDGEAPFYRLYINGIRVVNKTLGDIERDLDIELGDDRSRYDEAQYDVNVYEESED